MGEKPNNRKKQTIRTQLRILSMDNKLYYSNRVGITFDKGLLNIVHIIDDFHVSYIKLPYFNFETFCLRCLRQDCLFIIDGADLNKEAAMVRELIVLLLLDSMGQFITESAHYIPATYKQKFETKNIEPCYHKPLWLCTFFKQK